MHRLLAASLGIQKLPTVFQDGPQLNSIAESMEFLRIEYVASIIILELLLGLDVSYSLVIV